MNQHQYDVTRARDILYLHGEVPHRRVVKHGIRANTYVLSFPVVVATPHVSSVRAIDDCEIDPHTLTNTEVDSRFDLTLVHSLGPGYRGTFAYEIGLTFPPGHVTRECRGFAPRSLEKAQIIVAFDPTTPPRHVYSTVWAGPSDGTILHESPLTLQRDMEVFDAANKRWPKLPLVGLVDMQVESGVTFGIRWEW